MRLSATKDLAPLKLAAQTEVDQQAGEVRKQFITTIPGQEMVYMEKRREAELVLVSEVTDPLLVPHIIAEASLNDRTLTEQAEIILGMATQCSHVSQMIETKRLTAKMAIEAATNPAEIELAKVVEW